LPRHIIHGQNLTRGTSAIVRFGSMLSIKSAACAKIFKEKTATLRGSQR
jgi:hypothetical protein